MAPSCNFLSGYEFAIKHIYGVKKHVRQALDALVQGEKIKESTVREYHRNT